MKERIKAFNLRLYLVVFFVHILLEIIYTHYLSNGSRGCIETYGTPLIDFFAIYPIYLRMHKYLLLMLIGTAPVYSIIFYALRRYQHLHWLFILYLLVWAVDAVFLLDPFYQQMVAPIGGE